MKYEIKISIECQQPAYHEFIRGVLHEKTMDFVEHIEKRLENVTKVQSTSGEVISHGVLEDRESV